MDTQANFTDMLDAAQALAAAPFVGFLFVLIVATIAIVWYQR